LNIDYKSLTNLSDASRREALQSMTQLYQRISRSQLQLQHFDTQSCANCGSRRHTDCSARSSNSSNSGKDTSTSKDKKKHSTTRQRTTGPTITRMPIRSSSHPQLVVVRPKPSRKSSSSSSPSSTKSHSPSNSTYTSPLASPLPLYIAEEPFELHSDGIIKGVLGGPMPTPPLIGSGRRRKDSFHDPRPSTWPEPVVYQYPFTPEEHVHLPAPKLPSFVPVSPRRAHVTPAPVQTSSSHGSKKSATSSPKYPPVSLPARRRIDKVTPSSYTFASDSTKLGEIPQRNWTTPWDYEEAQRLNVEAAAAVVVPVTSKEEVKDGGLKKKGLFRWMRRGSEGVAA
jgi:hypothetical protein